jgi:hypothetical protein
MILETSIAYTRKKNDSRCKTPSWGHVHSVVQLGPAVGS